MKSRADSDAQLLGRRGGSLDAGRDLRERDVPRGGGVVAEGGEAAVVTGAEPPRAQDPGCFDDPVADLLREASETGRVPFTSPIFPAVAAKKPAESTIPPRTSTRSAY